jgi:hypothetical protein
MLERERAGLCSPGFHNFYPILEEQNKQHRKVEPFFNLSVTLEIIYDLVGGQNSLKKWLTTET